MTIDEAINELTQCYSFNSKTAEKKNEAISMAIKALEKQRWHPITEKPPVGVDLIFKLYDKHLKFYYYHVGFYNGKKYFTYNFSWEKDKDLEIVGWQLCPWEEEQE